MATRRLKLPEVEEISFEEANNRLGRAPAAPAEPIPTGRTRELSRVPVRKPPAIAPGSIPTGTVVPPEPVKLQPLGAQGPQVNRASPGASVADRMASIREGAQARRVDGLARAATPGISPAAAAPEQSLFSRAKGAVGSGLRAIPGLVAGAAGAVGGYKAADALLAPPAATNPGFDAAIPSYGGDGARINQPRVDNPTADVTAPAAVPFNALRDTEVGRNLGNAALALPAVAPVARGLGLASQATARLPGLVRAGAGGAALGAGSRLLEEGIGAAQAAPVAPNALPTPDTGDETARLAARVPGTGGERDGIIYRDGNVYSGKNIEEDAQIQDRRTGGLRNGNASVIGGGAEAMGRNLRAAAMERSMRDQLIADSGGGGPAVGFSDSYQTDLARRNRDTEIAGVDFDARLAGKTRGGRRRAEALSRSADAMRQNDGLDRRAALDATTQAGIAQGRNATSLRAAQIQGEFGLEGDRIRADAVGGAARAKAAADAARGGIARQALAAANGDYGRAADLAARSGMPEVAEDLQKLGAGKQGLVQGGQQIVDTADKTARGRMGDLVELFKGESVGPDGKVNEGLALQKATILNRLSPNFTQLPTEQKQKLQMQASLLARIQSKIGAGGEVGIGSLFGTPPEQNELIPDLKGGSLSQFGVFKGATTIGIGRGEYALKLPNGREINVGQLNAQERELLQEMAAGGTSR
jgi:hypothetical protein